MSPVNQSQTSPLDSLVPQAFDVDPQTGFFPSQPLPKLPANFSIWEEALDRAQEVLYLDENKSEKALEMHPVGERWRSEIRSWPVLDTASLNANIRLLQGAHRVLSWLVHFYAHSSPKPENGEPLLIPRGLTLPLIAVSKELGTAPVLTFADVVLWNWEFNNPELPLGMDNISYPTTFSRTEAERGFYTLSATVELKGVEMLHIFESFVNTPDPMDPTAITRLELDLVDLLDIVKQLTDIFASSRDMVDPETFYWMCRPWWVGAEAKVSQTSWRYEGISNTEELDLAGPSAGQSSVMHALDIFLDIDHKLEQKRYPTPTEANRRAETGFMERMRRYMPGKHREYLQRLGAVRQTLREVVSATPSLQKPYNDVVASLKRLRDVHLRVACLFIITQSSKTPPVESGVEPPKNESRADESSVRGTGGNQLTTLLKAGRDATQRAMVMDDRKGEN